MKNQAKQKELIDALIANEKAIEALYQAYAEKIILYHDFWAKIAGEEESHAAWISTLYAKMNKGLADFSEDRFPLQAINDFIRNTEAKRQAALEGRVTLLEALETAVHLEKGLLESKFFEIFREDSMEIQIILEALRLGTQAHLREVERVWKQEKGGAEFEKQMD